MNPTCQALTNLQMLEQAEGVEDPEEQKVVGILSAAAALQEESQVKVFTDGYMSYESEGSTMSLSGELHVYSNWVEYPEGGDLIPRERVNYVVPND